MKAILTSLLLCTAISLGGCTLPPPEHKELLEDGAYPSLSEVPKRPETILSPAEREQLRIQLQSDNAENAQQAEALRKVPEPVLPKKAPAEPARLPVME